MYAYYLWRVNVKHLHAYLVFVLCLLTFVIIAYIYGVPAVVLYKVFFIIIIIRYPLLYSFHSCLRSNVLQHDDLNKNYRKAIRSFMELQITWLKRRDVIMLIYSIIMRTLLVVDKLLLSRHRQNKNFDIMAGEDLFVFNSA